MPPKSKKKTAAAKKKEMEELAQQEQIAEEDEFEFQKACLEIRVKELENLNLGLQRKSEYLESQNEVYKAQLEDLKEEKEDLVAHLQKCYIEEKTTVKELEDRLYGTHQAMVVEMNNYELKLTQKDKDFEEMRVKLGKKIMEAESKLTALEDFRMQKENLTLEKDNLKKTLEEERERFARNYDELENNLIRYREKLKNDSMDMMKKMASDVQRAGKLCLTATVKSAISENINLQDELETTSKENLKIRERLAKLEKLFRDKRMTAEVLEDENSLLHKKCLQYRFMTQELLDRQLLLERRLESTKETENDLINLKATHAACQTETEIQERIANELETAVNDALLAVGDKKTLRLMGSTEEPELVDDPKDLEIKNLQDVIVKTAIASKDLSQAENPEELEFLKERFKLMIVKIFHIACDFPDLPPEIKNQLEFPVPKITAYISYR